MTEFAGPDIAGLDNDGLEICGLVPAAPAAAVSNHGVVNHCEASVAGFALVLCGHVKFCENCARRVADIGANCPLCRAVIVIHMVMPVFS